MQKNKFLNLGISRAKYYLLSPALMGKLMLHKKILNFILIAGLSLSLAGCGTINKEAASLKAEEYLNKHILKSGIKAKATEVKDENGFYTVAFEVSKDGQVVDKVKVYVTKDGETLSLGPVFNMNKSPNTSENKEAGAAQSSNIPQKDKPLVELFVMSGCPFGLQAEAAFAPVIKALGDKIDFRPSYVIYSEYQGGGPNFCIDKASKYCSMHGAEEAREDIRQICIWKNQKEKWWDYINKFNAKCQINDKTPECSKSISQEVGIDFAKVEACLKDSGEKLLAEEVELNKKYNVEGSPSIIINGTTYNGGRSPNEILASICSGFKNKPEECNKKLEGGDITPAAQGGCGR
jgi:glutaredoxin